MKLKPIILDDMDEQGNNRNDADRIYSEEEDFVLEQPSTQLPPDPEHIIRMGQESIIEEDGNKEEAIFSSTSTEEPPFSENEETLIYTTEEEIPAEESPVEEPTITTDKESPEEPADEPNVEKEESVDQRLDNLTTAIDRLTEGLNERFLKAMHSAELFDKMYAEMASYKDDLYAKLLKPFILEAITILEDYRRTLDRLDTLTLEQIRKAIKNIPADIEDLLENNGVDIIITDGENPLYDRKLHQIIRTVETENPELDGRIAKNLRPGYAWNGNIIRQEKVEVYKLKK